MRHFAHSSAGSFEAERRLLFKMSRNVEVLSERLSDALIGSNGAEAETIIEEATPAERSQILEKTANLLRSKKMEKEQRAAVDRNLQNLRARIERPKENHAVTFDPRTWSPEAQTAGLLGVAGLVVIGSVLWFTRKAKAVGQAVKEKGSELGTAFKIIFYSALLGAAGYGGVKLWQLYHDMKSLPAKGMDALMKKWEETKNIIADLEQKVKDNPALQRVLEEARQQEAQLKAELQKVRNETKNSETREAGKRLVEQKTQDVAVGGLLIAHFEEKEKAHCKDADCDEVGNLLHYSGIQSLTIGMLSKLAQIKDENERNNQMKRILMKECQLPENEPTLESKIRALHFLALVAEKDQGIVRSIMQRRNKGKTTGVEAQVQALALGSLFQELAPVMSQLTKVSGALVPGKKLSAKDLGQALHNMFGPKEPETPEAEQTRVEELFKSRGLLERLQLLAEKKGISAEFLNDPAVRHRFFFYCARMSGSPCREIVQQSTSDKPEERNFALLLATMGEEISQKYRPYLKLYAHRHIRKGSWFHGRQDIASADVLGQNLDHVSVRDALQVFSYLGLAGNFDGEEIPTDLNTTNPLAAVLLQLKVLHMIGNEQPDQGEQLRNTLILGLAGGALSLPMNIQLPPAVTKMLRSFLDGDSPGVMYLIKVAQRTLFATFEATADQIAGITETASGHTPLHVRKETMKPLVLLGMVSPVAYGGYRIGRVPLHMMVGMHTRMYKRLGVNLGLDRGKTLAHALNKDTRTFRSFIVHQLPIVGDIAEWKHAREYRKFLLDHLKGKDPRQVAEALRSEWFFNPEEAVKFMHEGKFTAEEIMRGMVAAHHGEPANILRKLYSLGATPEELGRMISAHRIDVQLQKLLADLDLPIENFVKTLNHARITDVRFIAEEWRGAQMLREQTTRLANMHASATPGGSHVSVPADMKQGQHIILSHEEAVRILREGGLPEAEIRKLLQATKVEAAEIDHLLKATVPAAAPVRPPVKPTVSVAETVTKEAKLQSLLKDERILEAMKNSKATPEQMQNMMKELSNLDPETQDMLLASKKGKSIIAGAVETGKPSEVKRAVRAATRGKMLRAAAGVTGIGFDIFGVYMAYADWQENNGRIEATENPELKALYSGAYAMYTAEGTASAAGLVIGGVAIGQSLAAGKGILVSLGAPAGAIMLPIGIAVTAARLTYNGLEESSEYHMLRERDLEREHTPGKILQHIAKSEALKNLNWTQGAFLSASMAREGNEGARMQGYRGYFAQVAAAEMPPMCLTKEEEEILKASNSPGGNLVRESTRWVTDREKLVQDALQNKRTTHIGIFVTAAEEYIRAVSPSYEKVSPDILEKSVAFARLRYAKFQSGVFEVGDAWKDGDMAKKTAIENELNAKIAERYGRATEDLFALSRKNPEVFERTLPRIVLELIRHDLANCELRILQTDFSNWKHASYDETLQNIARGKFSELVYEKLQETVHSARAGTFKGPETITQLIGALKHILNEKNPDEAAQEGYGESNRGYYSSRGSRPDLLTVPGMLDLIQEYPFRA